MSEKARGVLVMGEINVHQRSWLRFSSEGDTPAGRMLQNIANSASLKQLVREPTRANNLLDLVLTNMLGIGIEVGGKIQDHNTVTATIRCSIPVSKIVQRKVWNYKKADWARLSDLLGDENWDFIESCHPDEAAARLTSTILEHAHDAIGQHDCKEMKSTHPWLTDEIVQCIREKHEAEGTEREAIKVLECSEKIMQARERYIERTRQELAKMKDNSKQWWKKTNEIQGAPGKVCNIPALKNASNEWVLDPAEKATLVAETLNSKYKIAGKEHNLYSDIVPSGHKQEDLFYPTFEMALNVLENLREDSGTGPDMLPARILKMCAKQLARPIVLLVTRMLCDGVWPDMWREHWIVPIFKRGSVFKPANYRGIHMTAQLSKIVERLIKRMVEPYLEHSLALGVNQFAYRAQRGARDALAFLTLQWMCALNKR